MTDGSMRLCFPVALVREMDFNLAVKPARLFGAYRENMVLTLYPFPIVVRFAVAAIMADFYMSITITHAVSRMMRKKPAVSAYGALFARSVIPDSRYWMTENGAG